MIYLIVAIGFVLRLWNLNQSLWLDEAINTLAVRDNSLVSLISKYSLGDFHPPLYHLVLWFWTRISGFSEIAVRMPSVILGSISVFILFVLFKKVFPRNVSLLAAAFLATSPLYIYYSQEARMYILTAFLAIISVFFYVEIIIKGIKTSLAIRIGYILSTLLMIYSDYLPFFLLLAQNIIILSDLKRLGNKFARNWFISQFILLFLFLPWLPSAWQQFQIATNVGKTFTLWNQVVGHASFTSIAVLSVKFLIGRISIANKFIYGLTMLPLLILIFYLGARLWIRKNDDLITRSLMLLFVLTILVAFFTSIFISVFSYFRFLFLLPLFYLLFAESIYTFKRLRIRILLISVFIGVNIGSVLIFNTHKQFWREDWKKAVSFVESEKNSLALMVNPAQSAPYIYYSRGIVPLAYGDQWRHTAYNTIWLIRYVQPIFDPGDQVRKNLEEAGFLKTWEYDFNGVTVWRYRK